MNEMKRYYNLSVEKGKNMPGIVSYGFYVPRNRITVDEIARTWRKNPEDIKRSLKISEKAVAGRDEDSLTMACEAAFCALEATGEKKKNIIDQIGNVFFGSETPAYAVNPTSTIIAEWLGLGNAYNAYDTQFACKAGTGALLSGLAHVQTGQSLYTLICAADKANARPNDALEFTAGSGANAWLIGNEAVIANIFETASFSSDTPDFWRRAREVYPSHGGRFTGRPAYFTHIIGASKLLLEKTQTQPEDYTYAVFHMPNGKFPLDVGKSLGFKKEQVESSLVVEKLGNSYSASALMGLVAVLDKARPGDRIFFCSYGSGAGSDAMSIQVTEEIDAYRTRAKEFSAFLAEKTYVDYVTYERMMHII
jgi:hydroxymethylglutaryl-CoA synthase